jgi:hypothetical protein
MLNRLKQDSRKPYLGALAVAVVGIFMLTASANASSVWTGLAPSEFLGGEPQPVSPSLTLDKHADSDRERGILAVIRIPSKESSMQAMVEDTSFDTTFDTNYEANAAESDGGYALIGIMIVNSGRMMEDVFILGGTGGISVPELGSAAMLGLGLVVMAAHTKRRVHSRHVTRS